MNTSTIAALIVALSSAAPASAQTYSLAGDWSNSSNPNGPWAYLAGGSPLPLTADWIAAGFSFVQPAWVMAATGPGHIPAWAKIASNQNFYDIPTGDVMVHTWDPVSAAVSGEAEIQWIAPTAGVVNLAGSTWIARDIGRSNDWYLRHNGVTVRSGSVFSGDPWWSGSPLDFATASGTEPLAGRPVAAGDVISFEIVRSPGQTYGDLCGVRLVITSFPDLGSCGAGSFPGGASLLTVDGSTGVPTRVITRAAGQSFTIGFSQPAGVPFPTPFAIFGRFGVPGPGDAYPLPLGIGTMCFTPAILSPADPTLFTVADSFGTTGLLPATLAPWSFTLPGGVPFPLLITLQGATYANATSLGVTNSIVLDVY